MTGQQESTLGTTLLAAYLNAAMQSTAAQAAYLATYGTAWAPLGDGTTISDAVTTTMATVR